MGHMSRAMLERYSHIQNAGEEGNSGSPDIAEAG
jgi:hypothetical protein